MIILCRQRSIPCLPVFGGHCEKKKLYTRYIKKGNISILWEIFGILGQPVAEGHDCKKHEDAANADDENDDHDHRVAIALFHYSHNIKDKRAVACRGLDAGQSEEKKSLKNVARSGDIL